MDSILSRKRSEPSNSEEQSDTSYKRVARVPNEMDTTDELAAFSDEPAADELVAFSPLKQVDDVLYELAPGSEFGNEIMSRVLECLSSEDTQVYCFYRLFILQKSDCEVQRKVLILIHHALRELDPSTCGFVVGFIHFLRCYFTKNETKDDLWRNTYCSFLMKKADYVLSSAEDSESDTLDYEDDDETVCLPAEDDVVLLKSLHFLQGFLSLALFLLGKLSADGDLAQFELSMIAKDSDGIHRDIVSHLHSLFSKEPEQLIKMYPNDVREICEKATIQVDELIKCRARLEPNSDEIYKSALGDIKRISLQILPRLTSNSGRSGACYPAGLVGETSSKSESVVDVDDVVYKLALDSELENETVSSVSKYLSSKDTQVYCCYALFSLLQTNSCMVGLKVLVVIHHALRELDRSTCGFLVGFIRFLGYHLPRTFNTKDGFWESFYCSFLTMKAKYISALPYDTASNAYMVGDGAGFLKNLHFLQDFLHSAFCCLEERSRDDNLTRSALSMIDKESDEIHTSIMSCLESLVPKEKLDALRMYPTNPQLKLNVVYPYDIREICEKAMIQVDQLIEYRERFDPKAPEIYKVPRAAIADMTEKRESIYELGKELLEKGIELEELKDDVKRLFKEMGITGRVKITLNDWSDSDESD